MNGGRPCGGDRCLRTLERSESFELVGEAGDDAVRGVELAVLLRLFVEGAVAGRRGEVDDFGGRLRSLRGPADVRSRRNFGKPNDVRRDVHEAEGRGGW